MILQRRTLLSRGMADKGALLAKVGHSTVWSKVFRVVRPNGKKLMRKRNYVKNSLHTRVIVTKS